MLGALVIDVVVPARDHAATLPAVLKGLPARDIRSVVVVDRASRDRTAELARDAGALVLREPTGGYGAACQRAQVHFSALPRVPDLVVFVPGDRPNAAQIVPALVAPIIDRGLELVLGVDATKRGISERVVVGLIDTVYRQRWSGVGPVRALKFPALVALGMRDRGAGWDVEMLIRASKLGLTSDELDLPNEDAAGRTKLGPRSLLHILRHATMR
jgi:glycosyltransferase involved in cell wall biosynthesis